MSEVVGFTKKMIENIFEREKKQVKSTVYGNIEPGPPPPSNTLF
jgi:hypothetical protein